MRCDDVELLLATRRDLLPEQERALQAHLLGCDRCTAAWQREQRTTHLLQALPSPHRRLAPPAVQQIRATLTRPRRHRRHQIAAASVIALCCVVLLGAVAVQAYPQAVQQAAARLGMQLHVGQTAEAEQHLYTVRYVMDAFGKLQRSYFSIDDAATQRSVQTIDGVDELIMSADRTRAYIGTRQAIVALDTRTKTEAWRTPVNNRAIVEQPDGTLFTFSTLMLSPDERWLYVLSAEFDKLWYQIVDTENGQLSSTTVALENCPNALPLTLQTGERMFVVCDNEFRVLNTRTQQWQASIPVPGIESPGRPLFDGYSFAVAPNGEQIYVAVPGQHVLRFDVAQQTATPVASLEASNEQAYHQEFLAISGDGTKLIINRITQGFSLPAPSNLPSSPAPGAPESTVSELRIVDLQNGQTVQRVSYPSPLIVASVDANAHTIYAITGEAGGLPDTVVVFDGASGQVRAEYKHAGEGIRRVFVGP